MFARAELRFVGIVLRGLLLCLVILPLASLDIHAERLPIRSYTTADGLAHNSVGRIVKDTRGFLWFCTADGLSRFDGYTFTNFGIDQGLPHASVNDFLETRTGEYWIATGGGLVRFDPRGRPGPRGSMFVTITNEDGPGRPEGITRLREGRDGTIWVGTERGLYRLSQEDGRPSLRSVPLPLPAVTVEARQILDVLEDAQRSLWVAAPSGLYRRWPDGSTARYTEDDGLPDHYLDSLLEDHEGHLWAGGRLGGLFRFTADATHAAPVVNLTFSKKDGLPSDWVFQLFESTDRRFWAATTRGILEFFPAGDRQGSRFRSYTRSNGLTYFDITALAEDPGGNLWLGTNTAGVMKLVPDGFRTFGSQEGLESVGAVYEDVAGDVCFRGTVLTDERRTRRESTNATEPEYHTRFGCFDGESFDWFTLGWGDWARVRPGRSAADEVVGWVNQRVTLHGQNGEWWVGTGQGLYRFPASEKLSGLRSTTPLAVYGIEDGLAAWQVYRLFEDSSRNIWVSTTSSSGNGLARWDAITGRLRDMAALPGLPSLKDELPRAFGEDVAGRVWIGFNTGLARYWKGAIKFFTARDGLPPGAIQSIYVDRAGRVWLATARGGLVRVDDGGADRPVFSSYTTTRGLSSNNTEVITEDVFGHIYIGGGLGLDRLDPVTGHVKHFTAADGLPAGVFLAAFRDRAGALWFGLSSGLSRLIPSPDRPQAAPPVWITGLRVRGVPQSLSALGEQQMILADLPSEQNQMEIDFVGLGFAPGERMRYQYRLDGADGDWSPLGEQRTVTYANLAAGRYTFSVRAVNSDGLASAQPAGLRFAILPPVWRRWWFVSLAGMALGVAVHAAYRYRLRRVIELANIRTRIATDLHDDIGANLTRIALLSDVAARAQEDGPIASIGRIARESVGSMSDIVWAINPKRDSLPDLIARMRQHAEDVFTVRDVALRFSAPASCDNLKLGIDVRRDLLLIFKEAVNNAVRHSYCSRVAIDLHIRNSEIELVVADNGRGFDTSVENQGQGLASMQRRARTLKGTLAIESRHGVGTTVTFKSKTVPV